MDNKNLPDESWESRLIDYSLGMMEPGEAAAFASSLAECREHVQLAQQYEQTMGWMGAAAQMAEPPEGHEARFMSLVSATPQEKKVSASGPALRALPSTMVAPVGPESSQAVSQAEKLSEPHTVDNEAKVVDLAKYRESRRNVLIGALGAVAAALILVLGLSSYLGQNNKLVIPAGYQVAQLAPATGYDTAHAVVLYDPAKNDATLLATGFPHVPAGKVYELWVLHTNPSEPPDAAGTFVPNASGASQHVATAAHNVGTYAGFAVTLEDAPGVPVAKGPVVVVGNLATHD
jgi:anti-sigma-K factor RskA